MNLNIEQYQVSQEFHYQGDDWWKWALWIDADIMDLDKIDHVVYTLHSTFPKPVRKITDRNTKFRLEAEGWGIFTIYIRLFLKDGNEIPLTHRLTLEYPDGTTNLA